MTFCRLLRHLSTSVESVGFLYSREPRLFNSGALETPIPVNQFSAQARCQHKIDAVSRRFKANSDRGSLFAQCPGMASRNGSKARKTSRSREVKKVEQPKSPMPAQHQRKPGLEAKLKPRPRYEAPHYARAGKLKDKVALIPGGGSGIGRAVAVLFAREGADVAITYLPEEESDAKETKAAIESEGQQALIIGGDITESKFCQKAVDTTLR